VTRRIQIRVTDADYTIVHSAAEASGLTLAEFCRLAARKQAEELLSGTRKIMLDDSEAASFVEAIENPGRFNAGLRWLRARPSVLPPRGRDT
jgi:uncharacterized protein (DUF1778 family)